MALERELKLSVTDTFRMPPIDELVPGLSVQPLPTLELDATYVDTRDLRLTAAGISLRRRVGEGPVRWTLKLPALDPLGQVLARRELDVDSDATEVPQVLAAHVEPWVGTSVLSPVADVATDRRRSLLTDGSDATVELADDRVTAQAAGGSPVRFRELELELLDPGGLDEPAAVALLHRLADVLRRAGAGPADPTSKSARVLQPLLADVRTFDEQA